MGTYERGWIAALLETASIHSESRGDGRRRVAIEIEHTNEELMARLASLAGVNAPTERKHEPKAGVAWRRTTYRVRVRGLRAEALLEDLLDDFTEATRGRVEEALLGATA